MECKCNTGDHSNAEVIEVVGTDKKYGDSIKLKCRDCGSVWVKYSLETEGISNSGRWFAALFDEEISKVLTADNAEMLIRAAPIYVVGGSAFSSGPRKLPKRIDKFPQLHELFQAFKTLADSETNDFTYSGWENRADAVAEIDKVLNKFAAKDVTALRDAKILLLPTGPLQELSMNSGWSHEYLKLADEFGKLTFIP